MSKNPAITVRPLRPADRAWAARLTARHFGSTKVISRRVAHATEHLPGFVAEQRGTRHGLLLYQRRIKGVEVVVLAVTPTRRGIGTLLLRKIQRFAQMQHTKRLWMVTTNDNLPARGLLLKLG